MGWSQSDLESALEKAQEDLAAGKMTTGAGDGTVMVKNSIDARPETRIRRILLALNKLDPTTYPISQITPITVTRVIFSSRSSFSVSITADQDGITADADYLTADNT